MGDGPADAIGRARRRRRHGLVIVLLGATLAVPLWGPTARAAHLPQCMWLIETPNVRGYTARCTGFQAFTGLFAESAYCTS